MEVGGAVSSSAIDVLSWSHGEHRSYDFADHSMPRLSSPALTMTYLNRFLPRNLHALYEGGDVVSLVTLELDYLPILRVFHHCAVTCKLLKKQWEYAN